MSARKDSLVHQQAGSMASQAASDAATSAPSGGAESRYGRIAWLYDLGAYLGSGGQIQRSKAFHLSMLHAPSRILYPGAGCGKEVALAAQAGHRPTVVELDARMLAHARRVFLQAGVAESIECVQGNALEHSCAQGYDAVVASYFLDVFSTPVMEVALEHLVRLLRPGGLLFLSGYAPLTGGRLHKRMQWLNHLYANFACSLLLNNARHGIYDYAKYFDELGLRPVRQKDFPHFGRVGPRFHRLWVAEKAQPERKQDAS